MGQKKQCGVTWDSLEGLSGVRDSFPGVFDPGNPETRGNFKVGIAEHPYARNIRESSSDSVGVLIIVVTQDTEHPQARRERLQKLREGQRIGGIPAHVIARQHHEIRLPGGGLTDGGTDDGIGSELAPVRIGKLNHLETV